MVDMKRPCAAGLIPCGLRALEGAGLGTHGRDARDDGGLCAEGKPATAPPAVAPAAGYPSAAPATTAASAPPAMALAAPAPVTTGLLGLGPQPTRLRPCRSVPSSSPSLSSAAARASPPEEQVSTPAGTARPRLLLLARPPSRGWAAGERRLGAGTRTRRASASAAPRRESGWRTSRRHERVARWSSRRGREG
ncbi:hypothetical protein C2845_PM15G03100 [Panicum miliaceum]|uniref:Uncharacterized protein n=1 Tax=Panicum miliaceum TaxID=4540 RepID=A0A3L6Q9A6_PANMI|nr:hypothetical protein C2845_PM15G03100 [Panicum miliaceum]